MASAAWTGASALCSDFKASSYSESGRESLLEQDAITLLLGRGLSDRRLGRRKVSLSGVDLVLKVTWGELRELLALLDQGADIDIARDEAAAYFKADLANIARSDAAGPCATKVSL